MLDDIKALELDPNKQYIFYVEVGNMSSDKVQEKLAELRDTVNAAGFTQYNFFAAMKHGVLQFGAQESGPVKIKE